MSIHWFNFSQNSWTLNLTYERISYAHLHTKSFEIININFHLRKLLHDNRYRSLPNIHTVSTETNFTYSNVYNFLLDRSILMRFLLEWIKTPPINENSGQSKLMGLIVFPISYPQVWYIDGLRTSRWAFWYFTW